MGWARSLALSKVLFDPAKRNGEATAMILLDAVIAYAAAGVFLAIAFVAFGISRVLPPGTPVTPGARVLLLPGAAILWPYVLLRWVKARAR
jgi:hypothetical protein